MVGFKQPGVYVEEQAHGGRKIVGLPTAITAFVGYTLSGPVNKAQAVVNVDQFERAFGALSHDSPVSYAIHQFFLNGGERALVVRVTGADGGRGSASDLVGDEALKTGLHALPAAELFNLLVVPETFDMLDGQELAVITAAVAQCEALRAFYIVDAPAQCTLETVAAWAHGATHSHNAATYFPAVCVADPLDEYRPRAIAPSGTLAGLYARIDYRRGVWKSPAGTDAGLNNVTGLTVALNDRQNGVLNPQAINALRTFPQFGRVAWGARTLAGSTAQADDYTYIAERRLALHIELSLRWGTGWAAFEPNGEALWAALRLNVGEFMNSLFRQGAFQGATAHEGYFVKCDEETTSLEDRNRNKVSLMVGFAPRRPGEFLLLTVQIAVGDLG